MGKIWSGHDERRCPPALDGGNQGIEFVCLVIAVHRLNKAFGKLQFNIEERGQSSKNFCSRV